MTPCMTDGRPRRKFPVHRAHLFSFHSTPLVFLTVCTHQRKAILARDDAHALITSVLRTATGWWSGRYVLMPDHLHLFCSPGSMVDAPSLSSWIAYWKGLISRRWPRQAEQPLWQKDFWDVQLRNTSHYHARWLYVRSNPVRHGLVAQIDQWPFAGEIFPLRFH